MNKLMTIVSVFAMTAAFSMGCKKAEETKPAEAKPAEVVPAPTEMKPAEVKPADPAAAVAPAATGLPECDAYLATAEKFTKCDKIMKEQKDAQLQALEAAKTGWAALSNPAVTPEVKKAAADACKASDDAMKAATTGAGCQ